jgi:hypothetical protein
MRSRVEPALTDRVAVTQAVDVDVNLNRTTKTPLKGQSQSHPRG